MKRLFRGTTVAAAARDAGPMLRRAARIGGSARPSHHVGVLLAAARAAVVGLSLASALFWPGGVLVEGPAALAALVLYGVYAGGRWVALATGRAPLLHPRRDLAIDLGAVALVLLAGGGPSRALPLLVVPLLSLGLTWQRRGALWAAAIASGVWVVWAGWGPGGVGDDAGWLGGAARAVYLACLAGAAVFCGEMAASGERSRRTLEKLGAADVEMSSDVAAARDLPRWAAELFAAPRALVAWEEPDEPWLYLASHEGGESRVLREASAVADLVTAGLADASFLSEGRAPARALTLGTRAPGWAWWTGDPLAPSLRERFRAGSVLSAVFDADSIQGRLFVFDKPAMTSDDVELATLVARRIGSELRQLYCARRLIAAAATDERARLGRDLHDGALHALAGVALEIEGLIRASNEDLGLAEKRLRGLQDSLVVEQRALRVLIGRFRAPQHSPPQVWLDLAVRLGDMVERIERRYGVKVEWSVGGLARLPDSLADEVYLAVHEGVSNAARHAHASTVSLNVAVEGNAVKITIGDDGHGFPFKGRFDQGELETLCMGPGTLAERVAALHGSLVVESTDRGARLEMSFPIAGMSA